MKQVLHRIEHIVEPDRLVLSWQSRRAGAERMRMLVGELLTREDGDADLRYRVDLPDFERACELGFEGYPGFPDTTRVHERVLSFFMKRLPPRTRKDFPRFLDALRIPHDARISDFALLGYSGAQLPDDDFTVVHPFDNAEPPFEVLIEAQGYRYYSNRLPFDRIEPGMPAGLALEPDNPCDAEAVAILIADQTAGYVCRGLAPAVKRWLDAHYTITATVERVNGPVDRREVFVFVSVGPPGAD